jgi:hypothetical protein
VIEDWWQSQGDPTALSWIIVFAYGVSVVWCIWAAVKTPPRMAPIDRDNHRIFWFIVAGVMLVLGVNKQLDLQLLLWLAGRSWIRSAGLNDYRALIQIGSMVVMTGVAGAGLAFFVWLSRDAFPHRKWAIAGVLVTALFVFIRAISLHGLDSMLGWNLAGLKLSGVLELAGILVVIAGTGYSMRSLRGRTEI